MAALAALMLLALATGTATASTCPNKYNDPTSQYATDNPLIDSSQMPAARPPPWKYCSTCAKKTVVVDKVDGHLEFKLTHKPIPGLTPQMMVWWLNNVEGNWTNPQTNQTFSRYLWWHPRDHVHQITTVPGPTDAVGATWLLSEVVASKSKTGWLSSDDPCKWSTQFYFNGELRVERLNTSGLTVAAYITRDLLGTPVTATPVRLRHDWVASPAGVVVNSTFTVGIVFDEAPAALQSLGVAFVRDNVNKALALPGFGGTKPISAGKAWQKHASEEMRNLGYFLPQLYATAATPP